MNDEIHDEDGLAASRRLLVETSLHHLVAAERHRDVLANCRELGAWIRDERARIEEIERNRPGLAAGTMRFWAIGDCLAYHQSLVAARDSAEAARHPTPEEFEELILEFDSSGHTFRGLILCAYHGRAHERIPILAARAERELPPGWRGFAMVQEVLDAIRAEREQRAREGTLPAGSDPGERR